MNPFLYFNPLFSLMTVVITVQAQDRVVTSPRAQVYGRATFYGGWALVADTCPSGTTVCPGVYGVGACCTDGTYCHIPTLAGSMRCCPGKDTDCYTSIMKVPVCADSSWSLWNTTREPICCEAGMQGVQPVGSEPFGDCMPADAALRDDQKAKLISSGTGSPSAPTQSRPMASSVPSLTVLSAAATQSGYRSSTSTPRASGSSSPNNPGNDPKDSDSNRSSAGPAVIGGAVGGAVALVALIGGFAWWYVRRYKRQVEERYKGNQIAGEERYKSNQTAGETGGAQLKSEGLYSKSAYVTELDAQGQTHEKP